jgi:hypothetical protein
MHSFNSRGFKAGTHPVRNPVWIALTALAFAFIGMMTVFGTSALPAAKQPLVSAAAP